MKTILLNVLEEKVGIIDIKPELEAYYAALNCDLIDIVSRRIGRRRFDIMRDDEGLLKESRKISAINNLGTPMFVGNLMFFKNDGQGNLVGLSDDDIRYINRAIQTMYAHAYPDGYPMLTQCEY